MTKAFFGRLFHKALVSMFTLSTGSYLYAIP